MLSCVGSLDMLVFLGTYRLMDFAREVASCVAPLNPVPIRDVFPSIRVVVAASLQQRWKTRYASSKTGENTASVSQPWKYTHIRVIDRRS